MRAPALDRTDPGTGTDESGRPGAAQVVALTKVHPQVLQCLQLAGRLDALRDEVQLQSLPERDDGPGHGLVLPVSVDALDEGLVDLQDVEGEVAQVGQR